MDQKCTDTTLLLSVERGTTFVQRYALTGLTCMAARLAADQRFRCARFELVSVALWDYHHSCFPCLKPELPKSRFVVLLENVETISSVILGKRSYPLVRTCQVPDDGTWYQVYQDNYLRAHGKRVEKDLVWVYTLLKHSANHVVSFAVIPPQLDEGSLKPFPQGVNRTLDCIFYLEKTSNTSSVTTGSSDQLAKRFYYTDPTQSK
jgi:hypothetical protein